MGPPPLVRVEGPERLTDFLRPTGERVEGREVYESYRWVAVWLVLWSGDRILLAQIPEGFRTDLYSVPRWARREFGPADRGWLVAVLHDRWLELMNSGLIGRPKFLADLLFLLTMVSLGVSFPRACVMFFSVRTKPFSGPKE